jgi:membrane protein involved in colicin uptake
MKNYNPNKLLISYIILLLLQVAALIYTLHLYGLSEIQREKYEEDKKIITEANIKVEKERIKEEEKAKVKAEAEAVKEKARAKAAAEAEEKQMAQEKVIAQEAARQAAEEAKQAAEAKATAEKALKKWSKNMKGGDNGRYSWGEAVKLCASKGGRLPANKDWDAVNEIFAKHRDLESAFTLSGKEGGNWWSATQDGNSGYAYLIMQPETKALELKESANFVRCVKN